MFFVYPGFKLLDLTGPLQVFADAERGFSAGILPYKITVASMNGGPIESDTPVPINSVPVTSLREGIDTVVIVGGRGVYEAAAETAVVRAVERLSERSRRVASVCSGAFLLAEAGLLTGKSVVTHWDDCQALAQRFPRLTVNKDKIYIRDGNIWTSAGVTAGIDLSLALVQDDWGRPVALSIARRLVTYMVRPGGQSQFSDVLELQTGTADTRFAPLLAWVEENLGADLRVEVLAERAHMSPRSFSRHFRSDVGQSPAKYVEKLRVCAAQRLLEESTSSVLSVALSCGFNDEERMRRAFLRTLSVSPSEYRSRFV